MDEVSDDEEPGHIVSGLIDLSGVDLARLETLDHAVLVNVLQNIRDEARHPEDAVAGFQASL